MPLNGFYSITRSNGNEENKIEEIKIFCSDSLTTFWEKLRNKIILLEEMNNIVLINIFLLLLKKLVCTKTIYHVL